MFLGQPLAVTFGLHTRAVDEQMQGASVGAIGNVDRQGLLASAQCAEIRHRPIQLGKLKQTGDHTSGLPQWQSEPRLQRQAIRRENSLPDCFLIRLKWIAASVNTG